jgi:hypothetical protein
MVIRQYKELSYQYWRMAASKRPNGSSHSESNWVVAWWGAIARRWFAPPPQKAQAEGPTEVLAAKIISGSRSPHAHTNNNSLQAHNTPWLQVHVAESMESEVKTNFLQTILCGPSLEPTFAVLNSKPPRIKPFVATSTTSPVSAANNPVR